MSEISVCTLNKFFRKCSTKRYACKNKFVNYKNEKKLVTSFYINIYI